MRNNALRVACAAGLLAAGGAWAESASATAPTFSGEVAAIIYNNCTECHRPDGGAPIPMTSYEEVRKRARLIAKVTGEGYMPPWKADKGDVSFVGERHLEPDQIAVLAAWASAGAPLGDVEAVPDPPVFSSSWVHGEPDMLLEMEEEMPIPASGPDIYRAFVVRIPELPPGKYLKGLDYRPRAIETAHHTLFSLDTTGESRRRSDSQPRPGYGGMESNITLGRIGGWAVGARPALYPDGVSVEIKPGTDLVLATHFHPVGKAEVERAQIALYLTDEPPSRQLTALDIPFGFGVLKGIKIPPGERAYTVREEFVMPVDALLSHVSPHAHYIGKTMQAVATFPDGSQKTIIRIKDWDFAWQEQYVLAEALPMPKGTRIDLEFVYDNSTDNPRNPHSPPQWITFGPETTDEMASMVMAFITDDPAQREALRQEYIAWVKEGVKNADISIVAASARAQRRDRFDVNGDGNLEVREVLGELANMRRRLANRSSDNIHLQILPLIALQGFKQVLLPWLLPRLAAAAVIFIALLFGLRWLLRRGRQPRAASRAEEDAAPEGA